MIFNTFVKSVLSVGLTDKSIFFVFVIAVTTLLVDLSLIKVYSLGLNLYVLSTPTKVHIFIILAISGLIGQYLIIRYVNNKITTPKAKTILHLTQLQNVFKIFNWSLGGTLLFIIAEILLLNYYHTMLLIAVTSFSYILGLILLGLLALRFFSWFKFFRSIVGFCYGLTAIGLAANSLLTLIYVNVLLMAKPAVIGPFGGGGGYQHSIGQIFYTGYALTTIISFVLTWVATAVLLHHYSYKLGKAKYWTIIACPLIYFLAQFLTLSPAFFDFLLSQDPVYYSTLLTLLFAMGKVAGGIFFGIAFWLISRKLPHGNIINDYLIICAYGFIFFFISNQAIALVIAPYPPFGLIATTYTGLSSYLIMVGIYSSALSMAQDAKLRQSIRKVAKNESKLLGSIGIAQTEKEIQSKVIKMTRHNQNLLLEETGIQSALTDEDVKQYIHDVLEEVDKKKINSPR